MAISPTRVLTVALVATLLTSTGGMAVAAIAISGSLDSSEAVARREERTAYLIGDVALGASRLRSLLQDALGRPGVPPDHRLKRVRLEAMHARAAREALPAFLGRDELAMWGSIEPRLDRVLLQLDGVIAAFESGKRDRAQQLLDAGVDDTQQLFEQLDQFRQISVLETEGAVAAIQTRTSRTLEIATLGWAGLVAAMAFVWFYTLRLVSIQRASLASKMHALEAANRELEAFAARVAHDMRNVLSPIVLTAAAMKAGSDDPELRGLADRLDRSCVRGRDLVEGLLSFSSAGGRPRTSPQSADLAEELADVLDQLGYAILDASVAVETSVPPNARVAISPPLLHVLLVNLVGNAVKFMRGSDRRRLTVDARPSPEGWTIRVGDTGPGIPKHELERVFEPLYRGARARGTGVGLGLPTVRRIAEGHGGRVHLSSVVGEGTTITVTVPGASTRTDASMLSGSEGAQARPQA
jgi:signal transduction histidine kinase